MLDTESPNVGLTREQLEKLAETLKTFGFTIEPCDPRINGRGWTGVVLTVGSERGWFWDGREELPALAFAMLDVLDRAGMETRYETFVMRVQSKNHEWLGPGVRAHCFKGRLEEPGFSYRWTGPEVESMADTRTAAIALYLIAAHDAGLIPPAEASKDGGA
jgi:hypothetical protein